MPRSHSRGAKSDGSEIHFAELGDAFAMSDAHSFLGKYGGRFISADVLVPIR